MKEKEREESIEERKTRFNEYLVNKEMSRLKGIVECLIDVGRDLDGIDCNNLRKKPIVRIIEELIFYAEEKHKPLLEKVSLGAEHESEFIGRSEGYMAMLEIIQGVVRISGYR